MRKSGSQAFSGGVGYWIVDSLDALIIMNSTSRLSRAKHWISESLTFSKDVEVETLIAVPRLLGGLLSAHHLSTETFGFMSDQELESDESGEDLYIEKATDLTDRLLGAFESADGLPSTNVNLESRAGRTPQNYHESPARASSTLLELRYIALQLGEKLFWEAAERIAQTLDSVAHSGGSWRASAEFYADNPLFDLYRQLDGPTILYYGW